MNQLDLTIETRVIIGISAMVLLFTGFLISFITSQRKKLQYHKQLQLLNDQQQKSLQEQNSLLEERVKERTIELNEQKEALQTSLSKLKTTQLQLIQKEKMASLGELTAGIAHEIQNPLNFVNNFSEVTGELMSELVEEANAGNLAEVKAIALDVGENIEKIMLHGSRATAIVRGMLDHARPTSGERAYTNINSLAREYLRMAYQNLPARYGDWDCELVTQVDEALEPIPVVASEIGRVLLNVLNNAFYAVKSRQEELGKTYKPLVAVGTRLVDQKVEISIRDNGAGIPPEIMNKIFQPFFTTKPTGEGTGLGLSLSYDIVTKGHSGEMRVTSDVGTGTEFVVALPIDG